MDVRGMKQREEFGRTAPTARWLQFGKKFQTLRLGSEATPRSADFDRLREQPQSTMLLQPYEDRASDDLSATGDDSRHANRRVLLRRPSLRGSIADSTQRLPVCTGC